MNPQTVSPTGFSVHGILQGRIYNGAKIVSSVSVAGKTEELHSSLVAQLVKNPPAMQEAPVLFLSQEDPLEKG